MKTYIDKATCPDGHRFAIRRQVSRAGWKVSTRCAVCHKQFSSVAGVVEDSLKAWPEQIPKVRSLKERDIESYLAKRVKEIGGETRKLRWVGRNSAPDRIVMLPQRPARVNWFGDTESPDQTIWIEVKAPGLFATFPKNAHERAQHREHERMRKMGQRVEVVDSYERVDEVLK